VSPAADEESLVEQEDQDTQPFPDQQVGQASKEAEKEKVNENEPEVPPESLQGALEGSAAKKSKTSEKPGSPEPRSPIDVYRTPMRLIDPVSPHRDPNASAGVPSDNEFRPNAVRGGRMGDEEFSAFLAAGGLDDPNVYLARFPRRPAFSSSLQGKGSGKSAEPQQPGAAPAEEIDLTQESQESQKDGAAQ